MKKILDTIETALLNMGYLASVMLFTPIIIFFSVTLSGIAEIFIFGHIRPWSIVFSSGIPAILAPPIVYLFSRLLKKVNTLNHELEERANHDLLTGVYSRHFILESISLELSRFCRQGNQFTVLFIDFDDFKPVNDMYGHKVGDEALVAMAKTINSCLRDIDILGRYGGDEFLVCLPETCSIKAKVIAQRIQHSLISSLKNVTDHDIKVTASIGIYSPEDSAIDTQFIIEHADKAVYLAKMKGKNRIETV